MRCHRVNAFFVGPPGPGAARIADCRFSFFVFRSDLKKRILQMTVKITAKCLAVKLFTFQTIDLIGREYHGL